MLLGFKLLEETFLRALYKFHQLLMYLNIFTINVSKLYQCADPFIHMWKNKFLRQSMASK